jgi:hypothetical protein
LLATLVILSPSMMTTALLMTLLPSHSLPNLTAFTAAAALPATLSIMTVKKSL